MLENLLGIIVGSLALVATFMLPSKTQIQNNQAQKYKSKKGFIYIAGVAAVAGGILILLLYITDEQYQDIINVMKMAFLVVIGIALISSNSKKSKFMAQCETAGFPQAAQPGEIMAASVAPQAQVPAQQVGVQATTAVTPQVVTAQQVPPIQQAQVRGQPTAQAAQPRPVVRQPQAQAPQQPKILRIKCPRCKGDMQIDTRMLGQKMKCPHCGIEGKIG